MLLSLKVKKLLLLIGAGFIFCHVTLSKSLLSNDMILLEKDDVLGVRTSEIDDYFNKVEEALQKQLNLLNDDILQKSLKRTKCFDFYARDFDQKIKLPMLDGVEKKSYQIFNNSAQSRFLAQGMTVRSQQKGSEKIEYSHGNPISVMGVEAQKVIEKYKLHMGMQDMQVDFYVSENPHIAGKAVGAYADADLMVLSKGFERNLLSSDFKRQLYAKFVVFHELTHIKHQHSQYKAGASNKHVLRVERFLNVVERFLRYYRTHRFLLDCDDIHDEIEQIKAFFAEDIYLQQGDVSLFFKSKFAKKTEAIKEIFHRLDIIGECLYWERFDRAQREIDIITQHLYTLAREIRNDWTSLLIEFEADANAMWQLQCYKCVEILRSCFVDAVIEGRHSTASVSGSIVDSGGYFDYEAHSDLIWCLQQQGCLCEHHQRNYKLYD